jgi:hypothetical protein
MIMSFSVTNKVIKNLDLCPNIDFEEILLLEEVGLLVILSSPRNEEDESKGFIFLLTLDDGREV